MIYKIKDLVTVNRGSSPRPIIDYLSDKGYKWLKISDFNYRDRFVYETKEYIKEVKNTRYVDKGTLILTNSATPGIPIFLGNDMCLHDGFLYFTNCKEQINLNYLFYWFQNYRESIVNLANGSVFKNLKKEIVENLEIKLPSLIEQEKVVNILGKIDDKIELNIKMNNLLFELSTVLHNEWMSNNQNKKITNFVDVKELGKIVMGQSPKGESYNYENIGIPLINGAADYENSYLKAQKYTSEPTKICNKGDLIFCIRATIGLLTVCDSSYCLGRGVAGIVQTDEKYKEYAFHLINNSIEEFKRLATGSVILGISREQIEKIKVIVPEKDDIEKYHNIQKPIFDKIENIRNESKNLIQLRNAMLPKLMNGEIDLDNLEIY